jgi:serine/threonine protein kinase
MDVIPKIHEGDISVTAEDLGSGTFGTVRRGTWRGSSVAIKFLKRISDAKKAEHRRKMFEDEAQLAWSLVHPNLVKVSRPPLII